ncbi:MAG: FtsK/SpoIIIE domain-containing protein, partial [Pseudoclavibacter sp.]
MTPAASADAAVVVGRSATAPTAAIEADALVADALVAAGVEEAGRKANGRRVNGRRAAETPADRDERPIALPRPAQERQAAAFPWLMMLSPVALGIGLVLMTGSSFALVFAAIGPVLALGTVVDQSVQRRNAITREDERLRHELIEAREQIIARLRRERARRLSAHPPVEMMLVGGEGRVAHEASEADTGIALGTTSVPSGVRIDAPGASGDARIDDLVALARSIDDIPFVLAARSCAIAGPHEYVVAAALGLIVDFADRSPSGVEIVLSGAAPRRIVAAELARSGLHSGGAVVLAPRTSSDPDAARPGAAVTRAAHAVGSEPGQGRPRLELALVEAAQAAPARTEAVLEIRSRASATVRDHEGETGVTPQLVGSDDFQRWARGHLETRRRRGYDADISRSLPSHIDVADLARARPPAPARGGAPHLAAPIGVDAEGPVWIDLVVDGPHAIIGGTTGTGKSELLRTWIAGLAARYPATHVAFLCLDFKGGATFDAVSALPHCVGVVTDLDEGEAERVLASLGAELRRRERLLRDLGARDIAALEPGRLERLVVVVDEFQALIDEHRDLHDVFADLAARGRSLGIHLVLCAQRPAGAARESLLANCTIRLSLRVVHHADSQAVVGTPDATDLPTEPRGRGIVVLGGRCRWLQVATTDSSFLERIRDRRRRELESTGTGPPASPWLPPLPRVVNLEHFTGLVSAAGASARELATSTTVPIAILDDPAAQRQPALTLDLRGGAHVVVLGPSGAGKSFAVAAIEEAVARAGATCIRVPGDPEGAWDTLASLRGPGGDGETVVLIDDL